MVELQIGDQVQTGLLKLFKSIYVYFTTYSLPQITQFDISNDFYAL